MTRSAISCGHKPLARLVTVFTVHPSMPTRSVKELIALAKKHPKEILFGHAGYGSFVHLNAVIIESRAGIRITEVPFKGGGPAVMGLISGETQAMIAGIGDIIEHIKTKRARALGVSSAERVAQFPEDAGDRRNDTGLRNLDRVSVFAPAGTPGRRSIGSTPRWEMPCAIPVCCKVERSHVRRHAQKSTRVHPATEDGSRADRQALPKFNVNRLD